ncbi:MAG: hypothetical protein ACON5F_02500 [Jejuia sp.]
MKQLSAILFFIFLCSCEYFNVKKTTPEAILEEDLKSINWEDVDTYPSFSYCDSLIIKAEKKACFESTLYSEINEYLLNQNIIVTQNVHDTIRLRLGISKNGEMALLDARIDSTTIAEIPEIKEILLKSLSELPPITSATKRGQPVTTEFELPIIVKVD